MGTMSRIACFCRAAETRNRSGMVTRLDSDSNATWRTRAAMAPPPPVLEISCCATTIAVRFRRYNPRYFRVVSPAVALLGSRLSVVRCPQLTLLRLDVPRDPLKITQDFLENAAAIVRAEWSVRRGPLPDVLEKVEDSGILVSRIHVRAEKVDAFSQWSDRFGIPFIVLS